MQRSAGAGSVASCIVGSGGSARRQRRACVFWRSLGGFNNIFHPCLSWQSPQRCGIRRSLGLRSISKQFGNQITSSASSALRLCNVRQGECHGCSNRGTAANLTISRLLPTATPCVDGAELPVPRYRCCCCRLCLL